MRQLHGGGAHAVNARIVLVVAGAIDVELERARGVGGNGVRVERGREPRKGAVKLLIVAAGRNGEVAELRRAHLGVRLGAVGLQRGPLAGHRDRLLDVPDLEFDIEARDIIGVYSEITAFESLKSGHRHS